MDAIKLLKDDHETVKDLFTKFEKARSDEKKLEYATQAMDDLEVHAAVEEEIFYPAARKRADDETGELLAEAYEEHHVVKMLIGELRKLGELSEQFEAKFTVLVENVEHHIEEEEGELFPEVKRRLGSQLDKLGSQMETRKQELSRAVGTR